MKALCGQTLPPTFFCALYSRYHHDHISHHLSPSSYQFFPWSKCRYQTRRIPGIPHHLGISITLPAIVNRLSPRAKLRGKERNALYSQLSYAYFYQWSFIECLAGCMATHKQTAYPVPDFFIIIGDPFTSALR